MDILTKFLDFEVFKDQLKTMPIFKELLKQYSAEKPFNGLNVIIAHVLVPNTLPLIATIMSGGANVTVIPSSPAIDNKVIKILEAVESPINYTLKTAKGFDYALDVGGIFSDNLPKYGVIEVTRSGVHKYIKKKNDIAVISSDDSKCKLLETFIGNPQSTLLGFERFIGKPKEILKNKTMAVIGFGKIGRGIARLFRNYCTILVCDINETVLQKANDLGFKIFKITADKQANYDSINKVDFVISCTGFANTITEHFRKLTNPKLINLGNFDEFGDDYSPEEVFMSKDRPFNFNNIPPTPNRYIDPILASQAEALKYMVNSKLKNGFYPLPQEIDDKLVNLFLKYNNESIDDIEVFF